MILPGGTTPSFTVVMATYGRGRHILPSITSVLRQDLDDFELLVVGDACADETESVVAGVGDPRIRWLNLAARIGSQSGPNNAGIAAARAGLIAYLGHDDIWEPGHLARLGALYRSDDPPDFAVSGAIYHMPNGLPGNLVHGLFGDGDDVSRFFFPPSSFSHRLDVIDRIGPWRMPLDIRPPVDEDLLQRALQAGLRFRSTGMVTVHKFAAGHRYLSYVQHESDEQEAMLAGMTDAGHRDRVSAILSEARAGGTYMVGWDRNFDSYEPGEWARKSRQVKGLTATDPVPLRHGVTIRHEIEDSLFDWKATPKYGFRRVKANPKPKLLLPVTGQRARLRFWATHRKRAALGPLHLRCNGAAVTASTGPILWSFVGWIARYTAEIALREDRASVVELSLQEGQLPDAGDRRLAIGPLHLSPA
jgi:glycosyltransferase involved in cell wall biosynthesis